jgi:hypothetical protein
MSSVAAAVVALENLTLNVTQEIHGEGFAGGDL